MARKDFVNSTLSSENRITSPVSLSRLAAVIFERKIACAFGSDDFIPVEMGQKLANLTLASTYACTVPQCMLLLPVNTSGSRQFETDPFKNKIENRALMA